MLLYFLKQHTFYSFLFYKKQKDTGIAYFACIFLKHSIFKYHFVSRLQEPLKKSLDI